MEARLKILFVHQNFPGQYLHLAQYLAANPQNQVVFITQRADAQLAGVRKIVYKPARTVTKGLHHYLQETEAGILNAQGVARAALDLKQSGFVPDIMLGHNGWGEIWFLKDVYPHVPLLGYFEFFYRLHGADVGFGSAEEPAFDTGPRLRTKNVGNMLGLDAVDWGQCPTRWQHSLYPSHAQSIISVVHEGIDTQRVRPDSTASLKIPGTDVTLRAGDEVITYVARNLEPYRGFDVFMQSLVDVLKERPNAHVVIVGGDGVSYGHQLPQGQTHKQKLIDELGGLLDLSRVHFLGKVPYPVFIKVLQISRVHVYLTFPFVLSWSMLEAMAAGCLVIGSKTAPVEEVVRDRENGWLVPFPDASALSNRIVDGLENSASFSETRLRARQSMIDGFDLKRVCLPAQLALIQKLHGAQSTHP